MLGVDVGDHIDAGLKHVFDVLPTLGVAPAGDVGVRQLVDEGDIGLARDHRIGVHLLEPGAPVVDALGWDLLHALEKGLGIGPVMRLHVGHDHIDSLGGQRAALGKHGVALPHAGGRPEQDAEAPAPPAGGSAGFGR